MTFNYSRVAQPHDQCAAGSRQFGALGKFLSPGMPHTGRWIKSEADRDRVFWANIARVSPIGPRGADGAAVKADAYILQKDPDGSWFLDQWKQDSAGDARPLVSLPSNHDGAWRQPSENADTYFIIEIS